MLASLGNVNEFCLLFPSPFGVCFFNKLNYLFQVPQHYISTQVVLLLKLCENRG